MRIELDLPDILVEAIEEIAKEKGISIDELMEQCLVHYIERRNI